MGELGGEGERVEALTLDMEGLARKREGVEAGRTRRVGRRSRGSQVCQGITSMRGKRHRSS